MGKRGPKRGQGGRPIAKTDFTANLERLRKRRFRAKKRGDLEKVAQINELISKLTKVKPSTKSELEQRCKALEAENEVLLEFQQSQVRKDTQFQGLEQKWRTEMQVSSNNVYAVFTEPGFGTVYSNS